MLFENSILPLCRVRDMLRCFTPLVGVAAGANCPFGMSVDQNQSASPVGTANLRPEFAEFLRVGQRQRHETDGGKLAQAALQGLALAEALAAVGPARVGR
jgi:hypothetical protein